MSLVCAQCSRVNPAEASFCYHDGAALAGRVGGPVDAGSALFPSPFVFPDGQSCRNFDQLALACQQHWRDALDLLKKGFLGNFFGNIGRVDLARTAQEAADFPDADRGLDQLLAKLPTQVLQSPRLKVEPSAINLGQVPGGVDRTIELHLANLGMRLVYGSIASDCKWLAVSEAPGSAEKLFQFGSEATITVHVVGKHLRAGTKPLEGRLVLDSSGGRCVIPVRAEVPITPFQEGLFAGALTPRQIAEKAKANPREAAPYFESGAVAAWYASNGWNYPVQGPTMAGMGAVQQFFEALGVAKPPKLELATPELQLEGEPGNALSAVIEVATPERKLAYAWATSDAPWIEFGTTRLNGRSATVPVTVRIPARCAPALEAKLHVTGNGNQKFVVPIRVKVKNAVPVMETEPQPEPLPPPDPFADLEPTELSDAGPAAPPAPEEDTALLNAEENTEKAAVATAVKTAPAEPAVKTVKKAPASPLPWLHMLPLGTLVLALFGVLLHDIFSPPSHDPAEAGDVDPRPRLEVRFDYGARDNDAVHDMMTFGLLKLDPDHGKGADLPRLTYGKRGHTNSALVKVGTRELAFGLKGIGRYTVAPRDIPGGHGGKFCTFEFNREHIAVAQDVRIVPGEPVQVSPGEYKRLLDTCLVKYRLTNHDSKTHDVGFRFLLDTYIATEDGVPFLLPGEKELISTQKDFKFQQEVPDFLQVLQRPNLKDPGLIMQLGLRVSDKLEVPSRVSLTRPPGREIKDKERWEIPMLPMQGDSAVVMYWPPEKLAPGKSRDVGFTYGLGSVAIGDTALVGVSVGGSFYKGGELTVVALVADLQAKEIKLELPEGLTFNNESPAVQPVAALEKTGDNVQPSPVTWRVHVENSGEYNLTVTTNPGAAHSTTHTRKIKIEAKPLF